MKRMNKIFALALSLIMILGLATSVSAANTAVSGPFTVTINNATGHEYVIYQIFTGDLAIDADGEEILSNIKYGADYGTEGEVVPQSVLDAVNADPSSVVPTGNGTAMVTEGETATATDLVAGYYMIVDVTNPLPGQDTSSAVMFQVVGDTNITSKHTGTTIVKKTQDINDSTGEQPKDGDSVWIDSADYDMGDTVPFKSTANFEGMANYETYKVVITDIMAKGLEYKGDMAITVNGQPCTSDYTIEVTEDYASDDEYNGGTKIVVTFENIKGINGTVNDAEVVLTYSATLGEDANFGAPGNPNKIKATTKPDGEGEKDTPWDVNIIFTYKLESNKYANEVKEGNELTGAGFTLFKWIKNDSEAGGAWTQIGNEVKGEEMTKFEWKGIDDGKYKLEETTTPAGYNTIDPIEFEVVAEHVIVADNPTLTNLTGEEETGEITFSADKTSGLVSTDVVNNSGTVLPETGGIGTRLFYGIGGVLVVGAIILLITKKRMGSAE